jgi:hypothetical protein
MATLHIHRKTKTQAAEAEAVAALEGVAHGAKASARAAAGHVEAAVNGAVPAVATAARSGVSAVRRGARGVVSRLPATVRAARAGAHWTMTSLHTLPDQTLRSLAATSMGLGAGLSFTRAGRLGTVVGMVPAMVMETAIAVRPVAPSVPEVATE